jgi:hypothetical protein
LGGVLQWIDKIKPSLFAPYPIKRINTDIDYYSFAALQNGKLLLGITTEILFMKRK